MPVIGNAPVDAITTADVLATLKPILAAKRKIATRVKQHFHAVAQWAIGLSYITILAAHLI